ncbi:MAG: 3-oxoacyl-[acyl-carrier-protein] synthase III C-terminal domain-containing protein [Bdellovibrionia bacterium]
MRDSKRHACVLTNFRVILPRFQMKQEDASDWVYEAHALAESNKNGPDAINRIRVLKNKRNFEHYFANASQVKFRWVDVPDVMGREWNKNEIYLLTTSDTGRGETFQGKNIRDRTNFFSTRALEAFKSFYPSAADPPDHLIHVTCTGYNSPSAAQRIAAQHNWIDYPKITHAYHMGCYAALSSIRIAEGLLKMSVLSPSSSPSPRVDLVHTELCSLHMNPTAHEPEQIVIQSIFADGYIKYSAMPSEEASRGFMILEHAEQILPDTEDEMTWIPEPWGMGMSLSRNVPRSISLHLRAFIKYLFEKAEVSLQQTLKEAFFAIHPGGPKIIDEVQALLALDDAQVQTSRNILLHRGNMSSATLPHIWKDLIEQVPQGTKVVSLAFGPGLSILGSVFQAI